MRQQAALVCLWLGVLLLFSIYALYLPRVAGSVVGAIVENGGEVYASMGKLFVGAFCISLLGGLRFYLGSVIAEKITADVRTFVYRHLLYLDQEFHGENQASELASSLAVDCGLAASLVTSCFSSISRAAVLAAGSLTMLVVLNAKLAAVFAFSLPLVVGLAAWMGRWLKEVAKRYQKALARSNSLASERLLSIQTVQANCVEHREADSYGEAVRETYLLGRKRAAVQAWLSTTTSLIALSGVAVVLLLGIQQVQSGASNVSSLAQFVLYALVLVGSVRALAGAWGDFQRVSGGMDRIEGVLRVSPRINLLKGPEGGAQCPDTARVRFDAVCFSYPRGKSPALRNFSLTVQAGEKVAIVGLSGSGKSTIFNLLLRFYDPQEGAIFVNDIDIRLLPVCQVRSGCSVVSQSVSIFSDTVRNNIAYSGHDVSYVELVSAAEAANAIEFIEVLPEGFDTRLGNQGGSLSGGQRQRIAIARAFAKSSPVLLLDEATSALDAISERRVLEALARLMDNRTTLVIAHRLSTILRMNRIIVVDDGEVVSEGTHEELIASCPTYARLAKLQLIE